MNFLKKQLFFDKLIEWFCILFFIFLPFTVFDTDLGVNKIIRYVGSDIFMFSFPFLFLIKKTLNSNNFYNRFFYGSISFFVFITGILSIIKDFYTEDPKDDKILDFINIPLNYFVFIFFFVYAFASIYYYVNKNKENFNG